MRLSWHDLGRPRADEADGKSVEIEGFALTLLPSGHADHFLMMAEPGCCQGCVPNNRQAVVEVLADQPLALGKGALRLRGTWRVSSDGDGWRYRLHGASVKPGMTRRALMAASPLFCLPVPAMAQAADGMAVDIHSHAGNIIQMSIGRGQALGIIQGLARGGGVLPRRRCRLADHHDQRRSPAAGPRPQARRTLQLQPDLVPGAAQARPGSGPADRPHRGGAARGTVQPAGRHRLVGRRGFSRGPDRTPRRGLAALGPAPPPAHALSAKRAGRHPDRAQRARWADGLRRRGDPPLQPDGHRGRRGARPL